MTIENMRVLSIDDNQTNLLIVESYAKMIGLNIESCLDPRVAINKINLNEYDLIIGVGYKLVVCNKATGTLCLSNMATAF